MSGSPHLQARILVHVEGSLRFSHMYRPDSLDDIALSRGCILATREWAQHTFQGRGRGKEAPIAQVQLMGEPEVTSSPCPPPTMGHLQLSHVLGLSAGKRSHFQVRKLRSANGK